MLIAALQCVHEGAHCPVVQVGVVEALLEAPTRVQTQEHKRKDVEGAEHENGYYSVRNWVKPPLPSLPNLSFPFFFFSFPAVSMSL